MPIPTTLVLSVIAKTRLADDVSLGALARTARRSSFELHRAFRRVTGETPKRYTARLRLDHAAAQLVIGARPILEIALDAGFASHEVFTRAFLRRFGMSPRAYRARGLIGGRAAAAKHARIIRDVGPCVGLHHLALVERSPAMSTSVTKQTRSPQHALVIRKKCARTEIAQTLGQVLPRVFGFASQHAIPFAGPPFTRYLPSGPGLISIEAGMPIATPHAGEGDIVATELPGGEVAIAIHAGSYDTLADTHADVERWLDANGLAASAPWESYVTDPGTTPEPKDWRTEVIYPLR